jgi:DNA-binding response OmpR family regulator
MFEGLLKRSKDEPQRSVFVIGDDPNEATALADLLREAGYNVGIAVENEDSIVALEEEGLPHAFIVDFATPDVDARRFIEKARIRFGRSKVPPILMLMSAPDHETTANQIQVDDCLPKPFDQQSLLNHLNGLVTSRPH